MTTLAVPTPRRLAPEAALLLVCLIWGINFSAIKVALATLPPLAFTAVRFGAGSALMWWVARRREPEARPIPRRALVALLGLGVIGNTLYQLAFVEGLARTSAGNASLILAALPVTVVSVAGVAGLERITGRLAAGIAIATLGVAAVVASRGITLSSSTLRGDLLVLGAMICWALYTLGLRRYHGVASPLRLTAITMAAGTPGLIAAGLPQLLRQDWHAITPAAWLALAYSTVFSLAVAYLLWTQAVADLGPSRTAVFTCLTPVVALVTAALLIGERPTGLQLAGAGLIVAGVLWTASGGRRAATA